MAAAGGHREMVSYKECRRNHALASGGHAVDGCREFAAAEDEEALHCQACGCHRSFHRREVVAIRAHHVMVPPPVPAIAAVPVVVLQRAPVNLNLINPNNRLQLHQPQRDERAEIDGEIDFEGQKPYLHLMKTTTIDRF